MNAFSFPAPVLICSRLLIDMATASCAGFVTKPSANIAGDGPSQQTPKMNPALVPLCATASAHSERQRSIMEHAITAVTSMISDYMNGDFKCLGGSSPCAGDLVDWARNSRDNYSCEGLSQPVVSTVPNAYAVQSIGLFADIAGWLNRTDDAAEARRTAASLRANVAEKLFTAATGTFMDGLGFPHSAVHASIVAAATGVITTPAMADAVLAGLEKRGLYEGKVLTSCWIAGALNPRLSRPYYNSRLGTPRVLRVVLWFADCRLLYGLPKQRKRRPGNQGTQPTAARH